MVTGAEDLRTAVQTALQIEKVVRGSTAGFKTPTFVVDAPGGGGKRDARSFEHYNRETGVSVYRSPSVNPDKYYFYCDPVELFPESGQKRSADPAQHDLILREAEEAARAAQAEAESFHQDSGRLLRLPNVASSGS